MSPPATDATTALPARPQELTLAFLQRVFDAAGDKRTLTAFSWKALEVGVISEVVGVHVDFTADAHDAPLQQELIAKFLRPEFPFETMFQVESNFYTHFATSNEQKATCPFGLPRALYLSKQLIIMERVEDIDTYACVHGIPESQILHAVTKLAQMHGRFWNADCSTLATNAGIGSELSGDAKQQQFPDCWRAYLDDVPLEANDRERVTRLCEKLSENPSRLARIHDAVANGPSTLIHGDFHTGNLLFAHDQTDKLWLVDWATCGTGNPMRDLAFFFIVGVRSEHRTATESTALRAYAETIHREGVDQLTLADWTRHYRTCVLNQFAILVVYDHLSKHLATNAKSEKLRQELHAHFREVNARACLAVLDHFDVAAIEQL